MEIKIKMSNKEIKLEEEGIFEMMEDNDMDENIEVNMIKKGEEGEMVLEN